MEGLKVGRLDSCRWYNTYKLQSIVNEMVLNPRYAQYLALVKAARNGAVYGAKVRFPHALVYVQVITSTVSNMSSAL